MSKILFTLEDKPTLLKYLVQKGLVSHSNDILSLQKAGDSNMNFTIRIKKKEGSLILKQSKPYVEKYPQIPAPEHRVRMERKFYALIGRSDYLKQQVPSVLFSDEEQDVLVLEDLGELSSYERLYTGEKISKQEIDQLLVWLKTLHSLKFTGAERAGLENREMRVLNHEHIFDLPLRKDNGLDLDTITEGLAGLAKNLQDHEDYVQSVKNKGRRYLQNDSFLLHGDYYPASWLRKAQQVYIIDVEFSFFGPREFDLGVMMAHLILSGQQESIIDYILAQYPGLQVDLVKAFAGIEIMRRLIGVAQLPLGADLEQKKIWLERSKSLVLG